MEKSSQITLRGITKSFAGVLANDHVDLDIGGGEIHALLGENGAGKSTLMKILYGFYRADAGEIRLAGAPVRIRSPQEARNRRIGMVFQDFILIPAFTVAENIALYLPDLPAILDRRLLAKRIEEVSKRYDLTIDPTARVGDLSIGERQKLEVLKLLLADARILILDEPTRSLAPHEIEGLFRVLANLRADGYAIVFITHKMKEVLACADRITVMRRGRVSGTLLGSEATEEVLVKMMFGEGQLESPRQRKETSSREGQPILELHQVATRAQGEGTGLQDIRLSILPGEVLGVAGVSGNGQRELGDVILGLEPCTRGTKYLWGEEATHWSVARTRASGVAFIPEDPLGMAAFSWLSVQENMALADTRKYSLCQGLAINWEEVRTDLQNSLDRLGFKAPPMNIPIGKLSGGNIQRVILAREIARNPKLVIAFYPTRGLDVRSANAARNLLLTLREEGAGILLISEDLGELFSLSDRLIVLFRGRIVALHTPQEISINEIGYLMTGARGGNQPYG